MPRALFSVHDKTGLVEFGRELAAMGWEIIASGGTAKALEQAGVPVTLLEHMTRHPEMLGGRVKTLHPAVHAAILARDLESDLDELKALGYAPISMVVSNLYPFEKTVAAPDVTLEDAIEQIDIGGVTLHRAAAKNFVRVAIATDPADYPAIIDELKANAQLSIETRRRLAVKAFRHTRDYDTAIYAYLSDGLPENEPEVLPETVSISLHRVGDALRYGENPHQKAALYSFEPTEGPFGGKVLGGKELSYNNMLDIDAAWRAVASWDDPTVVIVKHLTPCGIGTAATVAEAFKLALASDPISAFGCVMAVNRPVDDAFVEALGDLLIEVIVAPEFSESAQNTLNTKRKNCRLLALKHTFAPALEYRSVSGGLLVQTGDAGDPPETQWKVVTQRQPTEDEMAALRYAWKAVQHVKSNAIVLAVKDATIGIGGGVSSRLDAAKLAVEKAGERAKGAVLASDAFFPFPDSLEVGISVGITAVIHPGGALRDKHVVAAADAAGIAMILTGIRHFRH